MNATVDKRTVADPWNPQYLLIIVVASVLVTAIIAARAATLSPLSITVSLLAAILAVLAWNKFSRPASVPWAGWVFLAASFLVAMVGLAVRSAVMSEWFVTALPFAVIAFHQLVFRRIPYVLLVTAPLIFGLLILGTASLVGNPAVGAFPAVFAALLVFIMHATRELERRTPISEDANSDPHIHILHRKPLAWLSIVFFLFGVITFWPWLGKMYGNTYFWILVLGVLAPLLYLWGRLRQPRRQNSLTALRRFNRVVPYLGLILLLAIALG